MPRLSDFLGLLPGLSDLARNHSGEINFEMTTQKGISRPSGSPTYPFLSLNLKNTSNSSLSKHCLQFTPVYTRVSISGARSPSQIHIRLSTFLGFRSPKPSHHVLQTHPHSRFSLQFNSSASIFTHFPTSRQRSLLYLRPCP